MDHSVPLIATLAVGFGLALVLGFAAERLRIPAIVGYLVTGIIIGPATPGFVADVAIARELAEIGVMLLMFGVGLHFSLQDLLSVKRIAVPGAIFQILVATALGAGVALSWGWSIAAALIFGVALSVASTVVLLKALDARGMIETVNGRIAVGWLVVEDLAMVVVLVLLPPLVAITTTAEGQSAGQLAVALGRTLLAVALFVALMLVIGRRLLPLLLWHVAHTGSRELFTLCVIVAAITIAFASAKLFGVSFALGAFFAGMVLRESQFSHRAAEETLPLRDAFAVLFFVSVGMLFEPTVLVESPFKVAAVVAIILVGKSVAAALLVLLLRYPLNTALTVSAALAQIGEFSFILVALGMSLGVLPAEGQSLILAGALISIALNPLVFASIEPGLQWIRARSAFARELDRSDDPLTQLPMSTDEKFLRNQVVIVGYGRVGSIIADALRERQVPFIVVEENREVVDALRKRGQATVLGNATEPATLIQAHITNALLLVIATPETLEVRQMIGIGRKLNPSLDVVIRSHNADEAALLEQEQAGTVFIGERELAKAMTRHVLETINARRTAPVDESKAATTPQPT